MAASILALGDEGIYESLVQFKQDLRDRVAEKAEKLETEGFETYMEDVHV
jgi:phosphoribosylcarboxyaminoimidazole (NCAIR) mutase